MITSKAILGVVQYFSLLLFASLGSTEPRSAPCCKFEIQQIILHSIGYSSSIFITKFWN